MDKIKCFPKLRVKWIHNATQLKSNTSQWKSKYDMYHVYHVEGKYITLLNKPPHTLVLDQKHFESATVFPCGLYTIEET